MIKTWISKSMLVDNAPFFKEKLSYETLSKENFQTHNRRGEVAMVLLSGSGLWMMRKDHYENSLYRIPTGGVGHEESVLEALYRETHEETSVSEVKKPNHLGTIDYEINLSDGKIFFHSYIFSLDFTGIIPKPTDPEEKISDFSLIPKIEIEKIARIWQNQENEVKKPYWSEWCKFRSILHFKVAELLKV